MNYDQILGEIKKSIIEKLAQIVPEAAYLANPNLTKHTYLDSIYTDIMALGYNFGDIKKAVDDIYEMQSPLFGEGEEMYRTIQSRFVETASLYSFFVLIFSHFHKETQAGKDYEEVLAYIKLALEKL
jgi:hypothetical protein